MKQTMPLERLTFKLSGIRVRPVPKRAKESQGVPVERVLADRIRAFRQEHGWSQDALGAAMAREGFGWTRVKVDALENGRRRVTIPELVGLAVVFDVPVGELLVTAEPWVQVAPSTAITNVALLQVLQGTRPGELPHLEYRSPRTEVQLERLQRGLVREIKELAKEWANRPQSEKQAFGWGDLDRRIRKRFGLEGPQHYFACLRLWGRSASDERDARAVERPNAKQWISRDLIAEMAKHLDERRKR